MLYLALSPDLDEFHPGRGPVPAEYAVVGACPSSRRRNFEPFGPASIKLLRRLSQSFNYVGEFYLTNAVKRPHSTKEKPRKKLVEEHYPLLIEELKLVQPRRIFATGVLPAQLLCPGFTNLREDHGSIFYNPELDCEVVPTFPFSSIAKSPETLNFILRDFERFLKVELAEPEEIQMITLTELLPRLQRRPPVFVDIETTGLDDEVDSITMWGVRQNGKNYYLSYPKPEEIHQLLKWFEEAQCPVVGHNLPFDLYFSFRQVGSEDYDLNTQDTMLMSHVAGQEVKNLKHLSTTFTDRPGSRSFGGPDSASYLAEDLRATEDLFNLFSKQVGDLLITQLLNKLALYVTQMRFRGVHIDYPRLRELKPLMEEKVEDHRARLDGLSETPVNWNSSTQVTEFLLSKKVVLVDKTPTGSYSVKESVMKELARSYPVAQSILDYREAKKELEFFESYLEKTSEGDPLLHPKLNLAGTRTGRLSCSSPNLQQVKRTGPIKTVFTSRHEGGYIGLIDLSQAELRIAALLADDDKFAEALLSDDVHLVVSSLIYGKSPDKVTQGERKASKAITFGLLYGGSPSGLAQRAGLTIPAVKKVIKELYAQYPGLERSIRESQEKALAAGGVTTPFGRFRDLKSLMTAYGMSDAARKAINTPIQSAASDIGLVIMYHVNNRIYQHQRKSSVIFGVHDSVLIDIAPLEVSYVASYVQQAFMFLSKTPLATYRLFNALPITGELIIGKSWAAVEDTNENYDPVRVIPCSSLESPFSSV